MEYLDTFTIELYLSEYLTGYAVSYSFFTGFACVFQSVVLVVRVVVCSGLIGENASDTQAGSGPELNVLTVTESTCWRSLLC